MKQTGITNTNEPLETESTKIISIYTVSWDKKYQKIYSSLSDEFINDLKTSTGTLVLTGNAIITINVIVHSRITYVKTEYNMETYCYGIMNDSRTLNDIRQLIIKGVKHFIELIEKYHNVSYSKIKCKLNSLYGYCTDTDNIKPCIIQIRRFNKFFEYDCLKVYSNGYTNLKNNVDEKTAVLINNDYVCSNHLFDEKNDIDTYVYVPRETGETK